jgi:chlorinating enzyme
MNKTTLAEGLSEQEIQHYRDQGFVVPAFRFEGQDLERLQQLTQAVVDANPTMINRPIPNPACPSFSQYAIHTEAGLMEFCARPDMVAMVRDLIGPDVVLWSNTIFSKPAEKGKRTPWHRDGEFWPLSPLATVTLWIAVTESNRENGCLRLIPASHLESDIGRHHNVVTDDVIFGREIDDDQFDPSLSFDVELQPGQMVFFDVRMIHGAAPNQGKARTAFTARYMPSTTRFNHTEARLATIKDDGYSLDSRPLFLLSGVDRAGNDFSQNYDPADDAAVKRWL